MSTGLSISNSNYSINMVLMDYDEPKPSKVCSNGINNNNKVSVVDSVVE